MLLTSALNSFLFFWVVVFARPVFRRLNILLFMMGIRGLGLLNYRSRWLSGESYLLKSILKKIDSEGSIALDIGANEGHFIEDLLAGSRFLSVVGFEPHPSTFKRLATRYRTFSKRVKLYNVALGERNGTVGLYDYSNQDGSSHASVLPGVVSKIHGGDEIKIQVEMKTLDTIEINGNISLLKIDVEGLELDVIKGATRLLQKHAPRYLIVEFNEMNIRSRTYMQDLLELLPDYEAYRILPGGKIIQLNTPYVALTHELFAYQNLFFERIV